MNNFKIINYEEKIYSLDRLFNSNYKISIAYGNTFGDLPLLKCAEKAYWVNYDGSFKKINF